MRISDWSSDVCSSDLALRAAFDDGGRDAAAGDVGEALGGEHYRDILLAQRLQPFADARGEQRMVEEDPGLVEDQQRRPAVEALLEPVEQIGDRKSVVWGKSVSVRVDLGGRRIMKKKRTNYHSDVTNIT